MKNPARIRRLLEVQGYVGHDDATLCAIEPWTRLAPALCLSWAAVGTALGSAAVIWALVPIAAAGALLPYHPFDLLYNHLLRHLTGTPALPRHGAPRRFGCSLAAAWLVACGAGFATGTTWVGYLFGASLVAMASVPVTTGLCLPSYLWMRLQRLRGRLRPAAGPGARAALVAFLLLLGAGAAHALETPRPVSPGSVATLVPTASPCPTFSWSLVPRATGYELAVYSAADDGARESLSDRPVLHERLPAGAGVWTPPADACLSPGAAYAWSVRAETATGTTAWSLPALFRVEARPDDLDREAIVRAVLERIGGGGGPDRTPAAEAEERAELERRLAPDLRARASLPPAPADSLAGFPRQPGSPGAIAGTSELPDNVQFSVNGAARASDYLFDGPRGIRLVVGASAFQVTPTSEEDVWRIDPEGFGYVLSIPDSVASVNLVAPVPRLPAGAALKGFSCLWLDGRDGQQVNFTFHLRRRFVSGKSSTIVATSTGSTVGSDPNVVYGTPTSTFEEPTVPDLPQEHFIEGLWGPSEVGSGLRFYGCELLLVVDRLRP